MFLELRSWEVVKEFREFREIRECREFRGSSRGQALCATHRHCATS